MNLVEAEKECNQAHKELNNLLCAVYIRIRKAAQSAAAWDQPLVWGYTFRWDEDGLILEKKDDEGGIVLTYPEPESNIQRDIPLQHLILFSNDICRGLEQEMATHFSSMAVDAKSEARKLQRLLST